MLIRDIIDTFFPPGQRGIRPNDDAGVPEFGGERVGAERTRGGRRRDPAPHRPGDPVESALDEALEETFPASDPIAVDPDRGDRSTNG